MTPQTRATVDASAGGSLWSKTPDQALQLIEEMAINSSQWPGERANVRRVAGMHELDRQTTILARLKQISTQISSMGIQGPQAMIHHDSINLNLMGTNLEQANYVNNRNFGFQGNRVPNYYQPGFRNHENVSYGNSKNVLNPPAASNSNTGFNNQGNSQGYGGVRMNEFEEFMVETRTIFSKTNA